MTKHHSRPDATGIESSAVWDPFRKSTFSAAGNCVEISLSDQGGARVRDSKHKGAGPLLEFSEGEWSAFLNGVAAGEFGTPRS